MSGAKTKRVRDKEGITWEYLENGQQSSTNPSILLIHGFLGGKQNWSSIIEVGINQNCVCSVETRKCYLRIRRSNLLHGQFGVYSQEPQHCMAQQIPFLNCQNMFPIVSSNTEHPWQENSGRDQCFLSTSCFVTFDDHYIIIYHTDTHNFA